MPIIVLAPLADRPSGERACEAMATRPGLLRGARIGDAVALVALAAALGGSAVAQASKNEVGSASDPSSAGPALVYETNAGAAVLRRAQGETVPLPGRDPATGGPLVATVEGEEVAILDRETLAELGRIRAPGADGLAIGASWLAVRTLPLGAGPRRDRARWGSGERPTGPLRAIAAAKRPAQLSRPALDGEQARARGREGEAATCSFATRCGRTESPGAASCSRAATHGISAPSIEGKAIAYVLTSRKKQALMVKGLGKGKGHAIYRRGKGPPTLWSTAIAGKRVFATVVKRGGGRRSSASGADGDGSPAAAGRGQKPGGGVITVGGTSGLPTARHSEPGALAST